MTAANPAAKTDALAVLAEHCSPMSAFPASQAASLLGIHLNVMQSSKPGDPGFVPFVPDQSNHKNRTFLLGDILTTADMADAVSADGGTIKREDAQDLLENRIGPPPPDWFEPISYDRKEETWESKVFRNHGHADDKTESAKRGRGRPRKAEQAEALLPGGRIACARRFLSTSDFLRKAGLDDEWLFAKPAGQRPYDFLDSALAGDQAPWQIMTLGDYLDAVRAGISADSGSNHGLFEAEAIARAIDQPDAAGTS